MLHEQCYLSIFGIAFGRAIAEQQCGPAKQDGREWKLSLGRPQIGIITLYWRRHQRSIILASPGFRHDWQGFWVLLRGA